MRAQHSEKWSVISSVKKRAKELQKRGDELTTTASEWLKRGERHRLLVFDKALTGRRGPWQVSRTRTLFSKRSFT